MFMAAAIVFGILALFAVGLLIPAEKAFPVQIHH